MGTVYPYRNNQDKDRYLQGMAEVDRQIKENEKPEKIQRLENQLADLIEKRKEEEKRKRKENLIEAQAEELRRQIREFGGEPCA